MSTENRTTGMTFGYARVSTVAQDEALQRDALAAATGCSSTRRPGRSPRGPRWTRCSPSCAPATPSSCGDSTAWAAR